MKLSYRGISYETKSHLVDTTMGQIVGKYRGANLRSRSPQKVSVQRNRARLTYRGISYN